MRFYDLFSGIGGFRLGLERAGHTCVGSCEIDRHAQAVYTRHFPGAKIDQDASRLDPDKLPDFDLLTAGFPCQPFSVAGKQQGFSDTRGTLFFEIEKIAERKRPRFLLLENVKGLLFHDEGRTFRTILATLDGLGYDAQWECVDGAAYLPQHRERVFIIGYSREEPAPQVFPLREGKADTPEEGKGKEGQKDGRRSADPVSTLTTMYPKQQNPGETYLHRLTHWDASSDFHLYSPDGLARSLRSNHEKTGLYVVPVQTNAGDQLGPGFKKPGDDSYTVLTGGKSGIFDGCDIRRLTPTECEKLQGFPVGWTDSLSDAQRYRCLGNAVMVPVIEHIGRLLK